MPNSLPSICETLYFPLRLSIGPATRYQYVHALNDWAKFLGRPAALADLNDDAVTMWMGRRLADGLSPSTVREMAGRVATLWTWLAKRKRVETFPTFDKPQPPETMPQAFTEEQLRRIFRSASKERGMVGPVPADIWWVSFLGFVWNSAERKSAALAVKIEWVDMREATVTIPPQSRKGGKKWACYKLWPETLELIRRCIDAHPVREHVWPWPKCHESYYTSFNRILIDAGIVPSRRTKTHALRCSHASWTARFGGDPSQALLHSDPATTRRHYLDPRISDKENPRLFIPWQHPDSG